MSEDCQSGYLEKCVNLYENYLCDYFYRAYSIDENLRRLDQNGGMLGLPVADKEVHKYVAILMGEASLEVLDKRKDNVVQLISQDVKEILDGLFTEDELKQLFEFATSVVGKKLLRNLELFGESFAKGNLPLGIEMISRWSDPSIWLKVKTFMEERNVQD